MFVSVVEIKNRIKALKELTIEDKAVLAVIDSYFGCPRNYVKANLASEIAEYAGCEAWKIAMSYTYDK